MNEQHKIDIISALVDDVFRALHRQEFYNWYTKGKWDHYISGDMEKDMGIAQSTAETLIKQDIRRLLNL